MAGLMLLARPLAHVDGLGSDELIFALIAALVLAWLLFSGGGFRAKKDDPKDDQ